MLLEDVFVEYLHGVKYTGGRFACDPAPEARTSRSSLVHLWAGICSLIALACASAPLEAQTPPDSVPRIRIRSPRDSIPLRLPTVLSRAERDSYRRAVEQIEAARATAFQQNMRSIIQAVW